MADIGEQHVSHFFRVALSLSVVHQNWQLQFLSEYESDHFRFALRQFSRPTGWPSENGTRETLDIAKKLTFVE